MLASQASTTEGMRSVLATQRRVLAPSHGPFRVANQVGRYYIDPCAVAEREWGAGKRQSSRCTSRQPSSATCSGSKPSSALRLVLRLVLLRLRLVLFRLVLLRRLVPAAILEPVPQRFPLSKAVRNRSVRISGWRRKPWSPFDTP
jgi:hypothetical protein